MKLVTAFDPASSTGGFIEVGAIPGSKVLLYNLSTILIKLEFEDGSTVALHPFEANWWGFEGPTPTIEWSKFDVLASNANPMSTCTVILYDPGEDITGVYPMSLVYLSAISNTVTISQGSISVLQNDGNNATNIIEATLLGSTGSNVLVKNDGTLTIAQYVTAILTTLFQIIPGATTPIKLGNTSLVTEILGLLKVDGTSEMVGALACDSTLAVTGNTSLSTLSTSGKATLNSTEVTNGATVDGTLAVTGNTSLSTASTSGLATLNSASVTGNETVGGTLTVTGNTSLSTVSTSGLATLNSASVTNNETIGGTLGVTGNTSLSTLSTSGKATLNSTEVTNGATVDGTLSVVGTTSLDNGKITTDGSGHITIPNGIGYRAKNATGTPNILLWLDNLNATQLQAGDSNVIQIDDKVGATWIQITGDATNIYFQFTGSSKLFFVNASGTNVASLDASGNMKLAGTLTQSTTP